MGGGVPATVVPLAATTYTLVISDPASYCVNDTDQVTVFVSAMPLANAGPDQTICQSEQYQELWWVGQ